MVSRIGALALVFALVLAAPAAAQDRDEALAQVRSLTETIIVKIETGDASEREVWAAVQGLTEALKKFSLMETEARGEDKVAPPASAFLRPGEEEPTASTEPGAETPLSDVPLPWFTARLGDAKAAMETVRSGVEERVAPLELSTRLRTAYAALVAINRPPA
jgi:hypothetical protein